MNTRSTSRRHDRRALEHQLDNIVVCTPPTGIGDTSGPGDPIGPLHAEIIVAALRYLQISDIITDWTPSGVATGNTLGHGLGHWARDVGTDRRLCRQPADLARRDPGEPPLADEFGRADPRGPRRRHLPGRGRDPARQQPHARHHSELSNASQHHARNQPVLLAGGAGGALSGGRYLDYDNDAASDPYTHDYESNESIHNLFVSILQLFGEADTSFGSADALHEGGLPGLV